MKTNVIEKSTREECNIVDDGIVDYNLSKVPFTQEPSFTSINRVIKDASGDVLAGINISGKNKISMSELKKGFEELDLAKVTTYLNSGNIIFSSAIDDKNLHSNKIKSMIKDRFELDIPVFVVLQEELEE